MANDPITSVWEEDLETAVVEALEAVRDITDEHMAKRAELHQSFTRVVSTLWVWPNSHAGLKLKGTDAIAFIPLSIHAPVQAAIAGEIHIPVRSEPTTAGGAA